MMRRALALAVTALLGLGAAPPVFPPIVLPGTFALVQSSVPPNRLSGFTPAPVPDETLEPPASNRRQSNEPNLRPGLFHTQKQLYQGEGYMPGSTIDGEQQKREKPLPGLNLSVPLN